MIHEIEQLIRSGNLSAASKKLHDINFRGLSNSDSLAYSAVARRLGLAPLSLQILAPLREKDEKDWSIEQKIEYAASLRSAGIVPEAERILRAIDGRRHPAAAFQLVLCLITTWQYEATIPLLQDYLKNVETSSYSRLVGQINLLQALLVCECFVEAGTMITALLKELDQAQFVRLYCKTLELAAQYEIARQNWSKALERLREADIKLRAVGDPLTSLFIKKWFAVARSGEQGGVSPELLRVRDTAVSMGHWETVRDCDFYAAKMSGDFNSLIRLHFGTPFQPFRSKVRKALTEGTNLPKAFYWSGQRTGSLSDPLIFDLASGQSLDLRAKILPGHVLHRLLIALCQDFYKPVPLLTIFSKLYPEEYFNHVTSPARVHQAIKRLREWMEDMSIPIEIVNSKGHYRLKFDGPVSIVLPESQLPLEQLELQFLSLRLCMQGRTEFTSAEAAQWLGSSKSVVKRLLKWGVSAGKVEHRGQTNQSRYKLAG
jgi:tetratricopeptide (TPR) repeat protein